MRLLVPEPDRFSLARYSAAIADLETLRRAVLLAVDLRARGAEQSIEFDRLADQTTVILDHGVRRGADPALVLY